MPLVLCDFNQNYTSSFTSHWLLPILTSRLWLCEQESTLKILDRLLHPQDPAIDIIKDHHNNATAQVHLGHHLSQKFCTTQWCYPSPLWQRDLGYDQSRLAENVWIPHKSPVPDPECKWSDFIHNDKIYSGSAQKTMHSQIRHRRLGLLGQVAQLPT